MRKLLALLVALAFASPALGQTAGIINGATPIVGGSTGQCVTKSAAGVVSLATCGGAATSVTVGSTTISSGTTGTFLYDNGGTLGETTLLTWLPTTTGVTYLLGTMVDNQRAMNTTGTFFSTPSAIQIAHNHIFVGAGSTAQQQVVARYQLSGGYTGSSTTMAMNQVNASAGTGATLVPASGSNTTVGNFGAQGAATGNTTGVNIGLNGIGSAAVTSVGVAGLAQIAKAAGTNIGTMGAAINTNGSAVAQIGGWFHLNQTVTPTVSAALIADNGAQTSAIFLARDNGSTVFTIADGGQVTATANVAALSFTSSGGQAFTVTQANSVSPTSPNRTITISVNGTTYYLAAKTTND